MPGKVGIIESDASASYDLKLFGKLPLLISSGINHIEINKAVPVDLPDHLIGFANDIDMILPYFDIDKTYIDLGISPSFLSDDWSFEAQTFRMPMRSFLIYQPDEKLTFLYGVAVYPYFITEVLPILGFIYKPNERLTFDIVPDNPNITYVLNDKVMIFAEGGYNLNNEFIVTRNGSKNVALSYENLHIGGGLEFKLNKSIECSFSTGGIFDHSLEYSDEAGKVNIDKCFYMQFEIEIKS